MRQYKILLNTGLAIIGLLYALVLIAGSAYATPTVTFDYPWYFIGHGGVITVNAVGEPSLDGNLNNLSLTVSSTSPSGSTQQLILTLIETEPLSSIFISPWLNFTSGTTDLTINALQVEIGSTVTAETALGGSSSVPIYDSTYGTLPASAPTYSKTARLSCNGVAYSTWINNNDADKDGICDFWETNTANQLAIPNGAVTYRFYCGTTPTDTSKPIGSLENPDPVCPSTSVKDIYVEVDALKRHKVTQQVIDSLRDAFANTLIQSGSTSNYALHIQNDTELDYHRDWIDTPSATSVSSPAATSFDYLKNRHFGTEADRTGTDSDVAASLLAKRQVFHYALFSHFQTNKKGSSGAGETPGNDFVISLGAFTSATGSPDQQEGTFMHELGHNLGLHHGGPLKNDGISVSSTDYTMNCKPNYLSVMSYSRQFSDFISNRSLNYSAHGGDLAESTLNEDNGLWNSKDHETVYNTTTGTSGTGDTYKNPPATPIDWSGDGQGPGVSVNINNLPGCPASTMETLKGYADWTNIQFNFKGPSSFYDGVGSGSTGEPSEWSNDELRLGNATAMRAARVTSLLSLPNLPSEATDRINAARGLVINGGLHKAIEELQGIEPPAASVAIEYSPVFSAIESVITSLEKAAEPAHTTRDAVRTPDLYLPSPYSQVDMGITSELIQCNDHPAFGQRVLMIRPNDRPACVLLDHVDEFEALGWTRVQ